MPRFSLMWIVTCIASVGAGCTAGSPGADGAAEGVPQADAATEPAAYPADADAAADADGADDWQRLFDGETLDGWNVTNFGGEGRVTVDDGRIMLDFGNDMTGITWEDADALPVMDYEVELEAKRVDGNDFFCGLTFPVGEDHCTLIVGGWGGTVVGLSSLDGFDASENETTVIMNFETGQWYHIRLRVRPDHIEAWIDDEQIVDVNTENRLIGIRPEVARSRPLGIATWSTAAALRNLRLRELDEQ